jgi:hypothetical protein
MSLHLPVPLAPICLLALCNAHIVLVDDSIVLGKGRHVDAPLACSGAAPLCSDLWLRLVVCASHLRCRVWSLLPASQRHRSSISPRLCACSSLLPAARAVLRARVCVGTWPKPYSADDANRSSEALGMSASVWLHDETRPFHRGVSTVVVPWRLGFVG